MKKLYILMLIMLIMLIPTNVFADFAGPYEKLSISIIWLIIALIGVLIALVIAYFIVRKIEKSKKKKTLSIILISLISLLPFTVFADGSSPKMSYKIIITNPNGVSYKDFYNNTKTIPYNTILQVLYENEITDDKVSLSIEYNNNWVEIQLSKDDYTVYKKFVTDEDFLSDDFEDKNVKGSSIQIYIVSDTAYLYNGPSVLFGKVNEDTIPVGTILKSTAYNNYFAYVEYDGVVGWLQYTIVDPRDGGYAVPLKEAILTHYYIDEQIELFNNEDLTIYKDVDLKEEIGKIPAYEIFTRDFYSESFWRINYNDITGWIKSGDYYISNTTNKENRKAVKDIQIYSSNSISKKKFKIPTNGEFIIEKYYQKMSNYYSDQIDWFVLIEYNGNKGWFYINDKDCNINEYADYYKNDFTLLEKIDTYNYVDGNIISTIAPGKYTYIYSYSSENGSWYFLENNNNWIYVSNEEKFNIITYDDDKPNETPKTPAKKKQKKAYLSKWYIKNVIIISVCGTIFLGMIVFAVICGINKKKKNVDKKITNKEEKNND